jgi:hypothetical protein
VDRLVAGSPLHGLRAPSAPSAPLDGAIAIGTLDRGRLSSKEIIGDLGWGTEIALEADVDLPQVVRLRPRARCDGEVVGSDRPHTDATGRVVISDSLRSYLGIDTTARVVAWTANGVLHVAAASFIPAAFAALTATTSVPTVFDNPAERAVR